MVLVAARVRYLWIQLMRWIWKKDDLQTAEIVRDNAQILGR